MKKYILFFIFVLIVFVVGIKISQSKEYKNPENQPAQTNEIKMEEQENAIEKMLEARKIAHKEKTDKEKSTDLFGTDEKVKILLIGVDKRIGQTQGHCDAIQLITIDKKNQTVHITAVPRGTYSPLPPGTTATSTDYYVSNACGLAGLEYGIKQIEKILGEKTDYIAVVGFSETLGILRMLKLPTTETLQWLRTRHAYAIGEPQRARNHSTFLKQMMIQYIPKENSKINTSLQYIMYKTIQTDLSFGHIQSIQEVLANMDFKTHPERIQLSLRPAHLVQDIPFIPENFNIEPNEEKENAQKKLFQTIEQKKNDPFFILWAFENDLWLQAEDEQKRESLHYEFLKQYVINIKNSELKKEIITDYILEMEHKEQLEWMNKGKEFAETELASSTSAQIKMVP